MVTLTIDNKQVSVPAGTTILDAHSTRERASLEAIPHFVHLLKDTLEELALHG